jgi:hypothetical protein
MKLPEVFRGLGEDCLKQGYLKQNISNFIPEESVRSQAVVGILQKLICSL